MGKGKATRQDYDESILKYQLMHLNLAKEELKKLVQECFDYIHEFIALRELNQEILQINKLEWLLKKDNCPAEFTELHSHLLFINANRSELNNTGIENLKGLQSFLINNFSADDASPLVIVARKTIMLRGLNNFLLRLINDFKMILFGCNNDLQAHSLNEIAGKFMYNLTVDESIKKALMYGLPTEMYQPLPSFGYGVSASSMVPPLYSHVAPPYSMTSSNYFAPSYSMAPPNKVPSSLASAASLTVSSPNFMPYYTSSSGVSNLNTSIAAPAVPAQSRPAAPKSKPE